MKISVIKHVCFESICLIADMDGYGESKFTCHTSNKTQLSLMIEWYEKEKKN